MALRKRVFLAHIEQGDFLACQQGGAHFGVTRHRDVGRCKGRQWRIAVARDKGFLGAVFMVDPAVDFADVGAIDVNADGSAVVVGIPYLVNVANGGRHRLHMARLKRQDLAGAGPGALGCAAIRLALLGATQHANQSPHSVIVDGRGLARAPDKADHREAVLRIGVQQKLLVTFGVRHRMRGRQPIVLRDQGLQQGPAFLQNGGLIGLAVDQRGQAGGKRLKAGMRVRQGKRHGSL